MVGEYMLMCLHSQMCGQAQPRPHPPASLRDKNLAEIQSKRLSSALLSHLTGSASLSGCCINRVSIASACFLMADLFHFNTLVTR